MKSRSSWLLTSESLWYLTCDSWTNIGSAYTNGILLALLGHLYRYLCNHPGRKRYFYSLVHDPQEQKRNQRVAVANAAFANDVTTRHSAKSFLCSIRRLWLSLGALLNDGCRLEHLKQNFRKYRIYRRSGPVRHSDPAHVHFKFPVVFPSIPGVNSHAR